MNKYFKKFFIVFTLFFLFYCFLGSITTNAYGFYYFTPRGVLCYTETRTNEISPSDAETIHNNQVSQHPGIVLISPATNAYDCYSYAFHSRDYNTNNWVFLNAEPFIFGEYDENLADYISGSNSFVISDYSVGDILIYSQVGHSVINENIIHAAVIVSNPNHKTDANAGPNDIMVVSKWGDFGLYYHDYRNCSYYNDANQIASYRPSYDIIQTISNDNSYDSYNFTINNKYRKIVKLIVEDEMDFTLNVSSTNGEVNSVFYDSNLIEIDNNLMRYNNNYSGSYVYHLEEGVYYYSVYFTNPNTTGTISTKIRKLDNSYNNAIMLDPGPGYLVGSEINILNNYAPNIDLYGYNTIHNGFTRLIYFDGSYVTETSRLDYYYTTSNNNYAYVSPFGTILAKNVNGNQNIVVYAFNKNNPTLVYKKNIQILEYIGSDIFLNWDIQPYVYDEFYLDIENEAPYNFLQFYDWYSTNTSVVTVDSLGYVRIISSGICYIYGDYIYNDKIHLRIYVTAS